MPVDAPDGTAAVTDTPRAEAIASMVGFPRESRISRPITLVILLVVGICLVRGIKTESHISTIATEAAVRQSAGGCLTLSDRNQRFSVSWRLATVPLAGNRKKGGCAPLAPLLVERRIQSLVAQPLQSRSRPLRRGRYEAIHVAVA